MNPSANLTVVVCWSSQAHPQPTGFIVWAVLGNAVGGAMFVALLKFGHVVAGTEP